MYCLELARCGVCRRECQSPSIPLGRERGSDRKRQLACTGFVVDRRGLGGAIAEMRPSLAESLRRRGHILAQARAWVQEHQLGKAANEVCRRECQSPSIPLGRERGYDRHSVRSRDIHDLRREILAQARTWVQEHQLGYYLVGSCGGGRRWGRAAMDRAREDCSRSWTQSQSARSGRDEEVQHNVSFVVDPCDSGQPEVAPVHLSDLCIRKVVHCRLSRF